MKILEIITEGLGYSTDPEQGKWYHEGRKAFKFGTTGNTIQDIAKKHGCPPEWLKAFHAGYQDQEGWGKGVSESKTAQSPKPRNFVAKNAMKTTSGAGAHKDKKKALKQGDVKHKQKQFAEGVTEGEPDYSVPGNWSAHSNFPPTKVLGSVYNTKGVYLGKWDGKRLIPDPNRDSVWHKWRDEQGDDWARNTIATAPQMIQQGRWTVKQDKQGVAETYVTEKAKSKAQQKFMGMVYAAKKGEKPASPEVAKVAKGMSKKSAKDYAQTKHKGKPEHVKEDGEGGATAGSTTSAMVGVGAVYKNKRAKKQKPGTNALDMKGVNLLTGGSIKR